MNETQQPLILVFYLDRQLFETPEIVEEMYKTINHQFTELGVFAIPYVLPTDDTVRIECLNPVTVSEPDMEKIKGMLDKLQKQLDMNNE